MSRSRRTAKGSGTSFETAMCRYLSVKLGVTISRLPKQGDKDPGDIGWITLKGQPIVAECKSPGRNSALEISQWWKEVEKEKSNVSGSIAGILLVKKFGHPIEHSYCIVNDEDWNTLYDENRGFPEVKHCDKSIPRSQWKEKIVPGNPVSMPAHGTSGKKRWYVGSIEDFTTLFDSMNDLPQVVLTDVDLFLLEETGQAVVSTTGGQQITINLAESTKKKD